MIFTVWRFGKRDSERPSSRKVGRRAKSVIWTLTTLDVFNWRVGRVKPVVHYLTHWASIGSAVATPSCLKSSFKKSCFCALNRACSNTRGGCPTVMPLRTSMRSQMSGRKTRLRRQHVCASAMKASRRSKRRRVGGLRASEGLEISSDARGSTASKWDIISSNNSSGRTGRNWLFSLRSGCPAWGLRAMVDVGRRKAWQQI